MRNVDSKIPNHVKELVEEYSCDISNADCMKGTCLNCSSVSVSFDDGASSSTSSSSSESEGDSDSDNDDSKLKSFQWLSIDGKANRALVSAPFDEVEAILKAKIKELKLHIFVRNEQYKAYNNLKNEMPPNAMFLHVDYTESYENKQQEECQSVYFGHTTFSLFTASVYIRHEESLINENFVIISEAKDHSRIAAHTCINKVTMLIIVTLSPDGLPEP